MKIARTIFYLVLVIGVILALTIFLVRGPAETAPEEEETPVEKAVPVSVVDVQTQTITYVETTGTVNSSGQVEVFPSTSGTIAEINVKPGQIVEKGQVIMTLTGTNEAAHPAEIQRQIAAQNLSLASTSLANAKASNQVGKELAEIQLQSAVNQFSGIAYDLQQIDQNIQGVEDSLTILNNTLGTSREKSERDLEKARNDIDDLIYDINESQDEKRRLLIQIDDLEDDIRREEKSLKVVPAEDQASVQAQIEMMQAELDAKEDAVDQLEDALDLQYTGLNEAKYGYQSASDGIAISDNQLISQIEQAQNQLTNLQTTKTGTSVKLGYDGKTSDMLELAEEQYSNTLIQLDSALDQASNQVKLAQLNYELAADSADAVNVKAPISGKVSTIDLSVGDLATPQMMITEIINTKDYELKVGIDTTLAESINPGSKALITIADKDIEVPVKSVSPTADSRTKLVEVLIDLPPLFFRNNQTMSVRLPLTLAASSDANAVYIPLDAVTIGTQGSTVFVQDGDTAARREITLGTISGDQVQVTEGLKQGDKVIVKGAKEITDGQKIELS